jgi:uncharacterized membrane protein YccC
MTVRTYALRRRSPWREQYLTAETGEAILDTLRRIRASQERTELDVADVKVRMSALEQHQGQLLTLLGTLGQRLDRFDERSGRIERRLDQAEA